MPQIAFSATSVRPKASLLPNDYFYSSSPADLPSVPNMPGGPNDRAGEIIDRFLPNIGDITRVPTQLDVSGCDLGRSLALNAARLNRVGQGGYTLHDIAVEVMDNDVDGFLVLYDQKVAEFARALYDLGPSWFPNGGSELRDYLNDEYSRMQRSLNGIIRGFNAILACAQATAFTSSDLDGSAFPPIVRDGAVPADFA